MYIIYAYVHVHVYIPRVIPRGSQTQAPEVSSPAHVLVIPASAIACGGFINGRKIVFRFGKSAPFRVGEASNHGYQGLLLVLGVASRFF